MAEPQSIQVQGTKMAVNLSVGQKEWYLCGHANKALVLSLDDCGNTSIDFGLSSIFQFRYYNKVPRQRARVDGAYWTGAAILYGLVDAPGVGDRRTMWARFKRQGCRLHIFDPPFLARISFNAGPRGKSSTRNLKVSLATSVASSASPWWQACANNRKGWVFRRRIPKGAFYRTILRYRVATSTTLPTMPSERRLARFQTRRMARVKHEVHDYFPADPILVVVQDDGDPVAGLEVDSIVVPVDVL
ncbi:hypothetical protein C8F04DRAFT_1175506 [Mycena alexandri]|uniref:Uncharacterized protein n=1 Tax=Mycena alexandri TaxID=1745969 RepID=A0AAD6TD58_9AGAR|nr:hypothetical protein C8F04DRAFT_1175506 [Mycena alexandri]